MHLGVSAGWRCLSVADAIADSSLIYFWSFCHVFWVPLKMLTFNAVFWAACFASSLATRKMALLISYIYLHPLKLTTAVSPVLFSFPPKFLSCTGLAEAMWACGLACSSTGSRELAGRGERGALGWDRCAIGATGFALWCSEQLGKAWLGGFAVKVNWFVGG